jgi:uncharacterized protein (DUF2336 family)
MRINTHVAILAAAIAAVTSSDSIVRSLIAERGPAPMLTLRGPADAAPSRAPVHLATARAGNQECLSADCGSPR